MSYYDDLRHPNWQKKRLEILAREDFTCQQCASKDETLHVHHTYYEKGCKPWEYPDDSLRVLCENCHAFAEDQKQRLAYALRYLGIASFEKLIGYACALTVEEQEYDCTFNVTSSAVAEAISDYLKIDFSRLMQAMGPKNSISAEELSYLSREASMAKN